MSLHATGRIAALHDRRAEGRATTAHELARRGTVSPRLARELAVLLDDEDREVRDDTIAAL